MRIVLAVCVVALACSLVCGLSGCATLAGAATGALTAAVDAPAEVYRAHREAFAEYPIWFAPDVLFFTPLGIATGPILGLGKGMALDIQMVIGQVDYMDVFTTYGPTSIWRPDTLQWPSRGVSAKP